MTNKTDHWFWIGFLTIVVVMIGLTAGAVYGLSLVFGFTFSLPLVVLTAFVFGFLTNVMTLFVPDPNKLQDKLDENRKLYKLDDDEDDDDDNRRNDL